MPLCLKWFSCIPCCYLAKVPITSSPSFLQSQGRQQAWLQIPQPSVNTARVLSICQVTGTIQRDPDLPLPLSDITKLVCWLEEVEIHGGFWGLVQQDFRLELFFQVVVWWYKSVIFWFSKISTVKTHQL